MAEDVENAKDVREAAEALVKSRDDEVVRLIVRLAKVVEGLQQQLTFT